MLLIAIAGGLCAFEQFEGPIPINKNLWTLSFVCLMGGWGFLVLGGLYTIIDHLKLWDGQPFRIVIIYNNKLLAETPRSIRWVISYGPCMIWLIQYESRGFCRTMIVTVEVSLAWIRFYSIYCMKFWKAKYHSVEMNVISKWTHMEHVSQHKLEL